MHEKTNERLVLGLGFLLFGSLFAARAFTAHSPRFGFLFWNLFLALLPWFLANLIERAHRVNRTELSVALGIAWILFLPNAPYIITDFVHLRVRPPIPLYYDVFLIGCASITGLLAGAFSVRRVLGVLAAKVGERAAWSIACAAILASGYGIYLGRFERWNSWDIALHPVSVLASIAHVPSIRALVVTFGAAGLLLIAVLAIRRPSPASRVPGTRCRTR